MSYMIQIAILDDHPLVIGGIEKMVQRNTHLNLAAGFLNAEELIQTLPQLSIDILLLDIQMPGMNGEEVMDYLHQHYPDLKVIALSGYDIPFYVQSMLSKGCKGYLLKNTSEQNILEALETVYHGNIYIEKELKEKVFDQLLQPKATRAMELKYILNDREKEVLKKIVQEKTSPEIAKELFMSARTVEKYRAVLIQKLMVKNTAGLVREAMRLQLIDPI